MKEVMMMFVALFVLSGCGMGQSDSKSVTTTAKVSEDGSEVVTSSQ